MAQRVALLTTLLTSLWVPQPVHAALPEFIIQNVSSGQDINLSSLSNPKTIISAVNVGSLTDSTVMGITFSADYSPLPSGSYASGNGYSGRANQEIVAGVSSGFNFAWGNFTTTTVNHGLTFNNFYGYIAGDETQLSPNKMYLFEIYLSELDTSRGTTLTVYQRVGGVTESKSISSKQIYPLTRIRIGPFSSGASGCVFGWGMQANDTYHDAGLAAFLLAEGSLPGSTITASPTATAISYGQTLASATLTGGSADVPGTFAFTTPTLQPSLGTALQSVTFTPTDAANKTPATTNVNVTVNRATPIIAITPTPLTISYGQSLASATLSGGAANIPGTFAYTSPSTVPGLGTAAQGVTFTPTDTGNYTTATALVTVTVVRATPLITTAPTAAAINYGQSLSSATLSGGAANVPGTFAFTTPATRLNAGTTLQGVTFTPTDPVNYTQATATVSITVNPLLPTIVTAPTAASVIFGKTLAAVALSGGAASVPGRFAFTYPNNLPLAGSIPQEVTFTPTDTTNYQSISLTVKVIVARAVASVTLGSLNQTYSGTERPVTATTVPANLGVDIQYAGSATAPINLGRYPVVATIRDSNYEGTASGTLVVDKTGAAVILGELTQTYTGTGRSATATTVPGGLKVNLTYGNSLMLPTNAGNYTVVGTIEDLLYKSSATGTLVVGKGTAQVILGNLTQPYTGTAGQVTSTTLPSGLKVDLTYPGRSTVPTSIGSYPVVGTINDTNYQGTSTGTLVVGKAAATITLGGLQQTYNGRDLTASATTVPAGLTVKLTYNGTSQLPNHPGRYLVEAALQNAVYQGTATGQLVVEKAPAVVALTLGSLRQNYTGTDRPATATTLPAGLAVNFTYNGSPAAPVQAGTYLVLGTINDANYQGTITGTLIVEKAGATVTLGALTQTYTGTVLAPTATTLPGGLNVNFSYGNSLLLPTNAGRYTVLGTIEDPNYKGSATGTLVVGKAAAQVVLGNLAQPYTGAARLVAATTLPSGLKVDLAYSGRSTPPMNIGSYPVAGAINDINYQGTSSGTLVIGKAEATVTLAGLQQTYNARNLTVSASTVPAGLTIKLTYNGTSQLPSRPGRYLVEATVQDTLYQGTATDLLVVEKAPAVVALTLGSLRQKYTGTARPVTAATIPAGLAVNFTYDGSPTVPVQAGTYPVVGTINDANYQGTDTGLLMVEKAPAVVALTLASLRQNYTGTDRPATATTIPAGLAVNFTYNGSPSAPLQAGSYQVVGAINDPAYHGTVTGTLIVDQAGATVTLGDLIQTYTGSGLAATATTLPGGLKVNFSYGNSLLQPTNAGKYTVLGTIEDPNFKGSATGTLVVGKAAAQVVLGNLAQPYTGAARLVAATTLPSGLKVDLAYSGRSTPPMNIGSYPVAGAINDINYQGTSSGTLVIGKAEATVTLAGLQQTYNARNLTVSASTVPAGLTIKLTYNGTSQLPSRPGRYLVEATVQDTLYQGTATDLLVVEKAPAVVALTLGSLRQKYTGTDRPATATTMPTGLAVNFTYDGSPTAPFQAGFYQVVGTINDALYQGTVTGTLVVDKTIGTVALGNLRQPYTGTDRAATAWTVPAGLAVNLTYDGSPSAPTLPGSYAVIGTINSGLYQGTTTGILVVDRVPATVTLENLVQTYSGQGLSPTARTIPGDLAVSYTYNGSPTTPNRAGIYQVVAKINDAVYQGSTTGTLIIQKATGSVTLVGLAQSYTGTQREVMATTLPAGMAVKFTYLTSATPPIDVGAYPVSGTITDSNYQGAASGTLVISKADATIQFGNLSQTYTGTDRAVVATTVPAGLALDWTFDGATAVPRRVGSYWVVASIKDPRYRGSASATLVVNKALAAITLSSLEQTYTGSARTAVAQTVPAGLRWDLTFAGTTIKPTAAGSYPVVATIHEANYEGSVTGKLVVAKAPAIIRLNGLRQPSTGLPVAPTATTVPAGLQVVFAYNNNVINLNDDVLIPIAAGTYRVTATVVDPNYQGMVTDTLVVLESTATLMGYEKEQPVLQMIPPQLTHSLRLKFTVRKQNEYRLFSSENLVTWLPTDFTIVENGRIHSNIRSYYTGDTSRTLLVEPCDPNHRPGAQQFYRLQVETGARKF